MDRIDSILKNELFLEHLRANERAEQDRIFCRHGLAHFLDVARIAEIINLENGYGIERETIYAAALLHDCGKHIQYESGTPHEQAGAEIAPVILAQCGFSEDETARIVGAIRSHRDESVRGCENLRGVLYRADKASRSCFLCESRELCNWKDGKKNLRILY